ncbi:MAG: hypothetical protein HOM55_10445 [Proteobacteria bacterium]|nr:hypothetical protein [Pseudomonadota bacterium]
MVARSKGRSLQEAKLDAREVSLSTVSAETNRKNHPNLFLFGGVAAGILLLVLLSLWEPKSLQLDSDEITVEVRESLISETNVSDGARDPLRQVTDSTTSFEEAEQARLRRSAQDKLAQLMLLQEALAELNVDKWAVNRLNELVRKAESGDRAYRDSDYSVANTAYGDALEIAESLKGQSPQVLDESIQAGRAALERMDRNGAKEAFARALWIEVENVEALSGLQRAEVQDELARGMLEVQGLQAAGDLNQALDASKDLALIDPLSEPVKRIQKQLEQSILERDFTAAMSSGYRYLDSEEFAAARDAFERARKLRADSTEVSVALQSVSNAEIVQRVDLLAGRARQAEFDEDWQQAVEAYTQILKLESGSIDGLIGKARAEARLTLDRKLLAYRRDPDSLLEPVVREQAYATLGEARALPSAGVRLFEQIANLEAELDKLIGEVRVRLISDGETNVRILRQSQLGAFRQEELILTPGKYIAVGSRTGYHDVRLEIIVRNGVPLEPVTIACTEVI